MSMTFLENLRRNFYGSGPPTPSALVRHLLGLQLTGFRLMNKVMKNKGIRTGWENETPESKARWFQSLSEEERMDLMCEFYDLIVENQPDIARRKRASHAQGPVQVLRKK